MVERPDTQFSERRRFPRYGCTGAVEILQNEIRSGWGTVNEMSRGGCYIETAQPLPRDTEVQLRVTIADTLLDINARVVTSDPLLGMGMKFVVASPEQEHALAQTIKKLAGTDVARAAPAKQEATEPTSAIFRITREAAPHILAKIIKRINEKGILTREELMDIVKASQ